MLLGLPDILLSITAITNIGLLWFVYQRGHSDQTNKLFSLFVAFITFWALVILLFRLIDSDSAALYLMKLSYVCALLLAYFFYQFSLLFPKPIITSRQHTSAIQIAVIAVTVFLLLPKILTLQIVHHDWGKEVLLDPYSYLIFAATFLFFFLGGELRLLSKIPKFSGTEGIQLKVTSITVLVAGTFGIYYNLVLPSPFYQNFQYIWSGPVFTFLFAVVITYSIFRFRILNPRAILAELLVYVLLLFLFIRLILTNTSYELAINGGLLVAVAIVGYLLIKGVTKEVEQRELIEKQEKELERANEGQANLIHIINHQIKGYLSKSRNIFAELLTNDYGPVDETKRPMLEEGLNSLTEGVSFVQEVLNSSSAEKGTLTYTFAPADLKDIVSEIAEREKKTAEGKGLAFEFAVGDGDYQVSADSIQLKEAVRNLIDNSVIYTPSGSVKVHLGRQNSKALLTVTDTGIGLSEEDKDRLFQKGGRGKDSLKVNINSTGFGLSFVKAVAEAHKGRVWASSEGRGKGSTFSLELPI